MLTPDDLLQLGALKVKNAIMISMQLTDDARLQDGTEEETEVEEKEESVEEIIEEEA